LRRGVESVGNPWALFSLHSSRANGFRDRRGRYRRSAETRSEAHPPGATFEGKTSRGIFRKKNGGNGIESIERELIELKKRKSALQTMLETAEADLARAIEDRRHRLLESDLDANGGEPVKDIVSHIRDSRDAIADAVSGVDVKIMDAAQRLDQEHDQIVRKAEADSRSRQLVEIEDARSEYERAAKRLVDTFDNVGGPLPQAAHLQMLIARTAADLMNGTAEAAAQLKGYITSVTTPGAPIFPQAPPVAAVPPPPQVERKTVYLLADAKWV
jgi:hypothetical protein